MIREKGFIHIYTGNGKGKTTAAFGLALRAAGRGMRTKVVQFMKGRKSGEIEAVERLCGLISVESFGPTEFAEYEKIKNDEHASEARIAFDHSLSSLSGEYDIIILDEIVTAFFFGFITEDEICTLMQSKPVEKELVLTGRGATEKMIELADLVTEMKEIKHYYTKNVMARKGIEE